jgi:hypothetical protein
MIKDAGIDLETLPISGAGRFAAAGQPGQWLPWDFGEIRVRVTYYTLNTLYHLRHFLGC